MPRPKDPWSTSSAPRAGREQARVRGGALLLGIFGLATLLVAIGPGSPPPTAVAAAPEEAMAGAGNWLVLSDATARALDLKVEPVEAAPMPGTVSVPERGVVRDAVGEAHLWLSRGGGRFERTEVTPAGAADAAGRLAVAGGVHAGEAVVARGARFLDRAALIQ